jgi:CHAD domain-containing protein
MNRQSGNKTGDLLYHYYQKRNASFLLNIYTAGITAKENDIHKARVDLKKIFALFDFFKMIGFDTFKIEVPQKVFNDVFKSAGEIREIQMNLLYIQNLGENDPALKLFSRYLKNNSKKRTRLFIQSIINFDEKRLTKIRGSIKKNCRDLDIEKIIHKCDDFFQMHSTKIKKYRLKSDETENIHKIRKEMKKISAIAGLLNLLRVDEFMENLTEALNQAELLIGEWHDRIVLNKSLDHFIKLNENKQEKILDTLERVKQVVDKEKEDLLNKLLPEADKVVILIAQIPFLRKLCS